MESKSLAYICTEDPAVKEKVDKIGSSISGEEILELIDMIPEYLPVIVCVKDSERDMKFNENDRILLDHKYDVMKEIDGYSKIVQKK